MATTPKSVLVLDVGGKRIGVAAASLIARIATPLTTLNNDENFISSLKQIVDNEAVQTVVIGLPRGLDGQNTPQTAEVQAFAEQIRGELPVNVEFQDEAVTSRRAEAELESRGKPYGKGDIDALAAVYILEDWLNEHLETS